MRSSGTPPHVSATAHGIRRRLIAISVAALAAGAPDATGQAAKEDNAGATKALDSKRQGALEIIKETTESRAGKEGVIYPGEIPVKRFLEFLAGCRGVPVLFDSSDPAKGSLDRTITIAAKTVATYEVVKATLEINGYRVSERVLADGAAVIQIETRPRADRLGATPIIVWDREKNALETIYGSDEIVTLIVPVSLAETILADGGECLAKGGIVKTLRVPEKVDAAALARLLAQTLAEASQPLMAATASPRGVQTRLVVEPRTPCIVLFAASRDDGELVERLLLDLRIEKANPAGIRRPQLYRIAQGKASAVAQQVLGRRREILASAEPLRPEPKGWKRSELFPIVQPAREPRIHPYQRTNVLLVQAEPGEHRAIARIISELDRPPALPPVKAP